MLQGKVAVVRRGGGTTFSLKAYRCQQAGAIACIIVNNDGPMPVAMAASDSSLRVSIPVIMVPKAWEQQVSSIVNAGQLQIRIGNTYRQFANDLAVDMTGLYPPKAFAIPTPLVKDTGDYKIPIGGVVTNSGTNSIQSAVLKATIRRVSPSPAVLYTDSVSVTNLGMTDSLERRMGTFDLVRAAPAVTDLRGQYRLEYEVYNPSAADPNPSNNRHAFDFYLTDSSYSMNPLHMDAGQPDYLIPAPTRFARLQQGVSLVGYYYHMPQNIHSSRPLRMRQVSFAVYSSWWSDTLPIRFTFSVDMLRWEDDGDKIMQQAELEPVGSGAYTDTAGLHNGQYVTVVLQDVLNGNDGTVLVPDAKYVIVCQQPGSDVQMPINDSYADFTRRLYDGGRGDWNYLAQSVPNVWSWQRPLLSGAFRADIGRVHTRQTTGTQPRQALNFRLYPNPAGDYVQLSFGSDLGTGTCMIRIRDLAGRIYTSQQLPVQGASSPFKLSTASLPVGVYTVEVATGRGTRSAKLVITR